MAFTRKTDSQNLSLLNFPSKDLPDYSKITFPETKPIQLEDLIPEASDEAVDLFKRFILYDSDGVNVRKPFPYVVDDEA